MFNHKHVLELFFVLFWRVFVVLFALLPAPLSPSPSGTPQQGAGGRGLRGAAPLGSLQPRDGTGSGSPQASPGSPGSGRGEGDPV